MGTGGCLGTTLSSPAWKLEGVLSAGTGMQTSRRFHVSCANYLLAAQDHCRQHQHEGLAGGQQPPQSQDLIHDGLASAA